MKSEEEVTVAHMTPQDMHSELTLEASRVYRELGIERVMNAADTYTYLGGGRLSETVLDAMRSASEHHVDIRALLAASGERAAELTRNPAALIVSGAAAAVAVATAACLSTKDSVPAAPEILVLASQRNFYLSVAQLAGVEVVVTGSRVDEIRAGVTDSTVAIMWFAGTVFEYDSPPLEEIARVAHESGLPLIVDAAAQFPPVSNLWTYRERGADLVIFSGGKGLRGPQASGLIVGGKELIVACAANYYPNPAVGRAMKSSKENIVGLLAALEQAVLTDWVALYDRWLGSLEQHVSRLDELAYLRTWIDPAGALGQECPRLFLEWEPGTVQMTADALIERLQQQSPAIHVGKGEGIHSVYINPFSLQSGELDYVVSAVLERIQDATGVKITRS